MPESTTTLTVRLPAHLKEGLERLACCTERSKSWLATDAIRAYVDLHEWQVSEIVRGIDDAEHGDFASESDVAAVFGKWAARETDRDAKE